MTPTLDCQACGDVVRELTAQERQRVANRPLDFVVYCKACRADAEYDALQQAL